MQFIVTTNVTGPTYYLRSTVWTAERTRASVYATEDAARLAIADAKMFNPKAARKARIVAVPSV